MANKSLVSLSDILNHPKTATTVTTNVGMSDRDEQSSMAKSKMVQPGGERSVEELFDELKLDCDEHLRQLDRLERERKQVELVQRRIVEQIKSDWLATAAKKPATTSVSGRRRARQSKLMQAMGGSPSARRLQSRVKRRDDPNLSVVVFQLRLALGLAYLRLSRRFEFALRIGELAHFFSNSRLIERRARVSLRVVSFRQRSR